MNDDEPNCWTCAYSNFPETAEPCASCDMYFSHFESSEPTESTDTAASEDARREAEMAGPTCLTCKHKGVSIQEEPCISCNGYQNYTPDESARRKREEELLKRTCDHCKHKGDSVEEEPCASCDWYDNYTPDEATPCAEGTDENDDVIEPCNTCTHRDNLRCNPPCSHCRQERGIEYPEYEEAEEDEEDVPSPCSTCKYGDLPGTVGPCASCFDEGLDHPLNYEEATESGDEGIVLKHIVPKHIVDMYAERVKQAALRFVNECNAYPRPCPYCGEIPEVVEETIYPGEEHCYVVCNGAKLLPHSISIHGLTREEAVARWNSFVLTMKSQEK